MAVIIIKKNLHYLRNFIPKYNHKIIHGIEVTKSGMVGAAHLVGQGNVKKWLRSNGSIIPKDGNGVSVEDYMKTFSGYQI